MIGIAARVLLVIVLRRHRVAEQREREDVAVQVAAALDQANGMRGPGERRRGMIEK